MADTIVTRKPISPAQERFVADLLKKINEPVQTALRADLNTLYTAHLLDTREASRQIDRLKAIVSAQNLAETAAANAAPAPVVAAPVAPVAAPARLPFPVVAPGRYAVVDGGVLRFYNVTRKASGRTEVKRYKSDDLITIRMGEAVAVLRKIEADPSEAAFTFAAETTRCFACGRRLTDPESIALGIGPDCASQGR